MFLEDDIKEVSKEMRECLEVYKHTSK